jgi:hypothetical protein
MRKRLRSLVDHGKVLPVVVLLLALPLGAADWPQLQGDGARSGFQPAMRLHTGRHTNSSPPGYGAAAWSWDAPEPLSGQPVTVGRLVVIGTTAGRVHALDAQTGALRWVRDVGAPVLTTLAIADSKVIVPTHAGELLALSASDGQTVWSYRGARKGYVAAPAIAGGLVLIGDKSGRFHCVQVQTGSARWVFDVGSASDAGAEPAPITASAAVLGDRVFFGAENLFAYALDVQTGARLWRRRLYGQSFGRMWPVASAQAGGVVIFRTAPVYQFSQLLIDDERFLSEVTGTGGQTTILGSPQQWLAEQRAISRRLRENPHRQSLWVLRASDGGDRYSEPLPVLYTGGSGDVPAAPVVDDINGRAWITARSAFARFDGTGVRPYGDLVRLNLNFDPAVYADGTAIETRLGMQFFACANPSSSCMEAWEDFHKISDEAEVLTATPNAVVVSNWVAVGGVDLVTHRTFNIRYYSSDDTGAAGLYGTHVGAVIANGQVILRDTRGLKAYRVPQ